MSERKLINKKEILIIVLVLLVCLTTFLYYYFNQTDKIAKIYVDSKLYMEIDLSNNKGQEIINIESNGKNAHILIKDDSIGFIDYECPDGVCQSAGMIKNNTQTAICLPLKVSIVIENKKDSTDIIAG